MIVLSYDWGWLAIWHVFSLGEDDTYWHWDNAASKLCSLSFCHEKKNPKSKEICEYNQETDKQSSTGGFSKNETVI